MSLSFATTLIGRVPCAIRGTATLVLGDLSETEDSAAQSFIMNSVQVKDPRKKPARQRYSDTQKPDEPGFPFCKLIYPGGQR